MKAIKKLGSWIASPKSDFVLFLAVLALANLVGASAFFRWDLTARRSYSLSEASRRVVRTIEEPLSVKVFFTANLPAPYNSVERYLRDLLIEYKGSGGKRFSYDFYDMERAENKELAESYGLRPIQVQEVKNDEVGVKNAYMGLAVVYSDAVENVNNITSAEGLEYRLTTTIGKIVSSASSLAALDGKIKATLYASSSLGAFGIQGYKDLDKIVRSAFEKANAKNRNKLVYTFVDSSASGDVDRASDSYGLQKITWDKQKNVGAGSGVLGIVLEYKDKSRVIPLSLARGLFGYGITGLEGLDQRISDNLQALMSNVLYLGYLSGNGEKPLYDERGGTSPLVGLAADSYEFKEIDLNKEDIPANLTTVVINGPRKKYSESELYKIDQFLMRGGSILAAVDSYDEIMPQGGMYGGQPVYLPVDTGLEALLEKYGVKIGKNYVMDSECYVSRQRGAPDTPLNFVPVVGKKGLDAKNPISRGLSDVFFLKASELTLLPGQDRAATALASSSPDSWVMEGRISLMPYAISKPAKDKLAKRNLAALVEGRFQSAFAQAPAPAAGGDKTLTAVTHLAKSVQNGKLIVIGTSEVTSASLVDEEGKQPIAVFVRNSLDYLAGNPELPVMRTKGLGLNPLDKTPPVARLAAKSFNQYALPVLVALAGLLAWRARVKRRERIQAAYAEAPKGTED